MADRIEWLYGLQHFGIKLGLDNIRALLALLDHPERRFRSVLVAGTNGKGSVAAFLESMLRAHGRRTGLFTSPHLVRPHERVRVDARPIPDEAFQQLLGELKTTIERGVEEGALDAAPSFFEVITAAALLHFARSDADVAVLEVGLGGRLDATNAVPADVSIITGIGLDHTKTLGPTIARIAAEKAGVIKPGKPLICGAVRQRAIDVIRSTCRRRGAPFVASRDAVRLVAESGEGPSFRIGERLLEDLRPGLAGRHQIDNARVALAALEPALGHPFDDRAVRRGLAATRWPGRLDWRPAENGRPALLLDAAHNPDGIAALARALDERSDRPGAILFGTSTGKPLPRMIDPLAAHAPTIVLTRPPVRRGQDVDELEPVARAAFRNVLVEPDPARALEAALAEVGPGEYLLVTGSLYLVGTVLGLLEGRPVPGPVSM